LIISIDIGGNFGPFDWSNLQKVIKPLTNRTISKKDGERCKTQKGTKQMHA
jgi:hypothetical protein